MKRLFALADQHKWQLVEEIATELDEVGGRIDLNAEVEREDGFPRRALLGKVANESSLFDGKKLMITYEDYNGKHEIELGRLSMNEIVAICSLIDKHYGQ